MLPKFFNLSNFILFEIESKDGFVVYKYSEMEPLFTGNKTD